MTPYKVFTLTAACIKTIICAIVLPGTIDIVLSTLKTRKVLIPCKFPRLD